MLVNLKEVLLPARKVKTCVGQFNVLTRGMARGVIDAAEEVRVPVVLGIEEDQLDLCSLEDFSSFVLPMAEAAKVPVAVNFDRASSMDLCVRALKLGFTAVSFDRSKATLEENEASVSDLARIAHAFGASVEGELGHTPKCGEKAEDFSFTDPDQVADYVERTGLDALAVFVGTAHGEYQKQPELDYDRIRAVSERSDVPLVLHGGSGLSDLTVARAIEAGISKIDIFTDINLACFQGDIQAYNDGIRMKTEAIPYELHAVRVYTEEKLKLFSGK